MKKFIDRQGALKIVTLSQLCYGIKQGYICRRKNGKSYEYLVSDLERVARDAETLTNMECLIKCVSVVRCIKQKGKLKKTLKNLPLAQIVDLHKAIRRFHENELAKVQ